ncbi:MAG: hypothetical protein IPF93_14775 [Saprospiraceae bacterium]|nr:hypothetical protein [Saprospiraceae bacterium]
MVATKSSFFRFGLYLIEYHVSVPKLTLVSLCFTLVVLSGCSSAKSKAGHSKKNIEDFDRFYDKFHQDGAFQMSRLKFPLQGHDGVGNKWTKTNWTLMKGRIYEVDKSQYKVEYKKTDKSFFQKSGLKTQDLIPNADLN